MAEEFKVNTYIVAGVIGISAGGLLLVRSFRTFRTVSYWNTIGMTTVGALMVYGGVKAFQMKGSKDTEKATSAIKEDVTKVIAEVGETAEVAASETEYDTLKCGNCGNESDADNFNHCGYCSKQMCNQCGDYNGDCTKCGMVYCYDDSGCSDCGEVCKDCECDCQD